jgi:hypothetical protein
MNFSYGKWTKYQILREDPMLEEYLPETLLFSEDHVWKMIEKYGNVVIKPSEGARGYGVINVEKMAESQYSIHSHASKLTVGELILHQLLNDKKYRRKLHIVQQGLPLARIENCPFDTRVVVKRNPDTNEWTVFNKLVRLAETGYFITNITKEILPLDEAINRSTLQDKGIQYDEINQEIDKISLQTALRLQEYYPASKTIGLDIGITEHKQLYIIEANLRPTLGVRHRPWTKN